jgi:hypothetical protein
MFKALIKVIREDCNMGCYNPPALKEISSQDFTKGGGAQKK